MVWKRIHKIEWYESANPGKFGKFVIEISYNPRGLKGALVRNWLRIWVPLLVQICKRFLKGAVPEQKTAKYAAQIKEATKELKK